MVLSIYIMITWFTITSFALYARKLSILENLFIYIIVSMIVINKATLVSLNFGYVEITKDTVLYLCHLLSRNVVIPLTLLLFCNIFYIAKKQIIKYASIFITLTLLISLEYLAIYFGIYTYKNWSPFIELLSLLLYILLTLLCAKWFRKRLKKDGIFI
ncbi:hypothetical protein [Halalkalibacter alkalisediminis]|uniref:Uncharacterized protein n=1 Tax=Halalkalibacter alkalisediminis TaxID=935616 RepID=A0ABV6NI19_9BACI|nr:hypothetical protein [Halalkalibacter alkalisediminis]